MECRLDDAQTRTLIAAYDRHPYAESRWTGHNARLRSAVECRSPVTPYWNRIGSQRVGRRADGNRIVAGEIRGPATDAALSRGRALAEGSAQARHAGEILQRLLLKARLDAPPALRGLSAFAGRKPTLCRLIEDHGGIAVRWPTRSPAPRNPGAGSGLFDRLATYDLAIFTSATAVEWRCRPSASAAAFLIAWISPLSAGSGGHWPPRHRPLPANERHFSSRRPRRCPLREVAVSASPSSAAKTAGNCWSNPERRGAWWTAPKSTGRERPTTANIEGLLARWKHGEIGAVTRHQR